MKFPIKEFLHYFLIYISCSFLVFPVVSSVAVLLIAYINFFGGEMSSLSYFSWIVPISKEGNMHLNSNDIMNIFYKFSFVFFVLKLIGESLIRNIFKIKFPKYFNFKINIGYILITLTYLCALCSLPFMRINEAGGKLFFLIFLIILYVAALALYSLYFITDKYSKTLDINH